MKDFAKSIKTNNEKVGNKAIVLKDGDVWVVLYANETKSKEFDSEAEARAFAKQVGNKKVGRYGNRKVLNEKAIGSWIDIDELGAEVGHWVWDWKKTPNENEIREAKRKIQDYVRQIDKNVPYGESDEKDEIFDKLDRFMGTIGFK